MKIPTRSPLFQIAALLLCLPAFASAFIVNTESDGSDGALTITEDTLLPLPEDGIFHFNSVTINEGATLRFIKNSANTPVYMLSTGDIIVNGAIDVSGGNNSGDYAGEGGPGGWSGGNGRFSGVFSSGGGKGPGGGEYDSSSSYSNGNHASHASSAGGSSVYGSPLLVPLLGGSGGGGAERTSSLVYGGGGGGGGAILLASDTEIRIGGAIDASGGSGGYGNGSGGGIRLLAPFVYSSGLLETRNGSLSTTQGIGYVRVDASYSEVADFHGLFSRGRNTIIFPENAPELRIKSVAGTAIPLENLNHTYVNLPASGQAEQPIIVQADGFDSIVNIQITLVPSEGARVITEHTIDNRFEAVTEQTFTVTFPLDQLVDVYVFTSQLIR